MGNQRVLCIHVQVIASVLSQEMSLLDKEGRLLRGEALLVYEGLVCIQYMYFQRQDSHTEHAPIKEFKEGIMFNVGTVAGL